eukprot:351824-Chlamydomonas_euryale.AAC.5
MCQAESLRAPAQTCMALPGSLWTGHARHVRWCGARRMSALWRCTDEHAPVVALMWVSRAQRL